jgi:hypothetical protein
MEGNARAGGAIKKMARQAVNLAFNLPDLPFYKSPSWLWSVFDLLFSVLSLCVRASVCFSLAMSVSRLSGFLLFLITAFLVLQSKLGDHHV